VEVPHKVNRIIIRAEKTYVVDVNITIYKSFGENTDHINK